MCSEWQGRAGASRLVAPLLYVSWIHVMSVLSDSESREMGTFQARKLRFSQSPLSPRSRVRAQVHLKGEIYKSKIVSGLFLNLSKK